jgi:DNA-directed RNA polymerase specialized sigma subunit
MLFENTKKRGDSFTPSFKCKTGLLSESLEQPNVVHSRKGKTAQKRSKRPWLRPNGKPLYRSQLIRESRSWDAKIWEDYLRWYQRPCKEALISSLAYETLCETRSESIYDELGYKSNPALRSYCEIILDSLPWIEAQVLRQYFFDGLTELQVAIRVKKTPSGVHRIKKRALFRLKNTHSHLPVSAIHIMRGNSSHSELEAPSLGIDLPNDPIREDRFYCSDSCELELRAIPNQPVRDAILSLTPRQQQCVYLRFWCNLSLSEIARRLGLGVNTAHDLCEVATFKIKSHISAPYFSEHKQEESV